MRVETSPQRGHDALLAMGCIVILMCSGSVCTSRSVIPGNKALNKGEVIEHETIERKERTKRRSIACSRCTCSCTEVGPEPVNRAHDIPPQQRFATFSVY